MRKSLIILFLFSCLTSLGQTEQFVRKTYDTLMTVRNSEDNSVISSIKWLVRITMDSTYLFDVARDPNLARRVFLSTGGKGEVATGNYATDTNLINRYGWEFWHNTTGYDYSVRLNNGIHHPIMVTILVPATMRPWYWLDLLRQLKTLLKPRGGKFDVAGLSEGSHDFGCLIPFSNGITGNTEAMSLINSWVNLEGVNPETFQSTDFTVTAGLQKWVTQFGGHSFGLDGTSVSVGDQWANLVNPMNTAKAGSAYFAFQNIGGGGHCCWNSMYDPTVTNWQCTAPITNLNIVANSQNTMGSYYVDPTTKTNIFQWMLRQGDTTLIGGCNPVINMGANQSFFLPQNSTTTTATVAYQCGHTASSTSWTQVSGPNTAVISASPTLTPTFSGLIAGTYVFMLHVVDGQSGVSNSNITIQVKAEVPPTVTAGGPYTTTGASVTLNGSVTYNGGTTGTSTWTQVSGPNTATITSPSSPVTTVTGLVFGVYVFQLSATDNNGNTTVSNPNATVTVSSSPPISLPAFIVGMGEYQVFYLNTVTKVCYGLSSNVNNIGVTSGAIAGRPNVLSFPGGTQIADVVGSLHSGGAIDINGNVWMWSEGDGGQIGDGNIYPNPVLTPVKILTDTLGAVFTGVKSITAGYAGNAWSMWYAIKTDGTLWTWGLTYGGMKGNGSTGDTCKRPTQIVLPAGKQAAQVVAGAYLLVRMTDGTVYSSGGNGGTGAGSANYADLGYVGTGTQYLTLHQLALSNIVQIAGGIKWSYALDNAGKLYGWGSWGNYLGRNSGTGVGTPVTTPTELTNVETTINTTLHPIRRIVTNSDGTHVLTTDGQMWAWGDQAQGGLGNGVELNYAIYVTPWAFDLGSGGVLMAYLPVRIAPGKSNFQEIWGGSTFNYYTYAIDSTGQLYSWGRNKGAILGNGIMPPNTGGAMEASYPNSWDVPWITPVNPFALTTTWITTCPGCVSGQLTGSPCNLYVIPANTPPVSIPNSPGTVSGSSAVLTNSSTDNVHITYYIWSFISGPVTPVLDVAASGTVTITGLTAPGTYTINLTVIDNGWLTNSKTITVVQGAPTNCGCLVIPVGGSPGFSN